eukprot:1517803-Prorocentrum_lima.AAC.1
MPRDQQNCAYPLSRRLTSGVPGGGRVGMSQHRCFPSTYAVCTIGLLFRRCAYCVLLASAV